MITEDYVSFETAKLMKEKGFDGDITTYRDDFIQRGNVIIPLQECLSKDRIKTPTLQMAMKWLREVYHIFIRVIQSHIEYCSCEIYYNRVNCYEFRESFNSYENACEDAIKYCLEKLI